MISVLPTQLTPQEIESLRLDKKVKSEKIRAKMQELAKTRQK